MGNGASVDADWFHHVDRGNVIGLGLKIDQSRGSSTVSLGGKVVVISNDWKDASALAFWAVRSVWAWPAIRACVSVGMPGWRLL